MGKNSVHAWTINKASIGTLSKYNEAVLVLRGLAEEFKGKMDKLSTQKEEILTARQEALDKGASVDKVAQEFSIVEIDKAINAAQVDYKAKCEPWRKAQADARKMIPKDIYISYKAAYEKGSLNGYANDIKDFLSTLGITANSIQALNKLARTFVARTSGARRASAKKAAEGNYISEKSKVQYADIFMLAMLQWLVTDKKVLKVLPDNTLVKNDEFDK